MNDSRYGLTAAIWTADMEAAAALARLETGTVFMNGTDYWTRRSWTGVEKPAAARPAVGLKPPAKSFRVGGRRRRGGAAVGPPRPRHRLGRGAAPRVDGVMAGQQDFRHLAAVPGPEPSGYSSSRFRNCPRGAAGCACHPGSKRTQASSMARAAISPPDGWKSPS